MYLSRLIKTVLAASFCAVACGQTLAASSNFNVPQIARDAAEFEEAVEGIVKRAIAKHPELIFEALQKHMMLEEQKTISELEARDAELGISAAIPSFGPIGMDEAVLFFFDYSCEACAEAAMETATLAYETGAVRLYLIDIASDADALTASRVALGALGQGQQAFEAMHLSLMEASGSEEMGIDELAGRAGLDPQQLREDMMEAALGARISASRELASRYEIDRLPSVVIGDTKLGDDVTVESLLEAIHQERDRRETAR